MSTVPIRKSTLIAISAMSSVGGQHPIVMPILIAALVALQKLPVSQIGILMSFSVAGYVAGTVLTPLAVNRVNHRLMGALSICATAATFLAMALAPGFLLAALCLNGLASGLSYNLCFTSIASFPNPERNVGIKYAVEPLVGMAYVYAASNYIIPHSGVNAALYLVAAIVLPFALLALALPKVIATHETASAEAFEQPQNYRAFALFLLSLAFSAIATGAVLAYIVPIAQEHHLGMGVAGTAIVFGVLGGVTAALSASVMGNRFGHRLPYPLTLLLAIPTLFLYDTDGLELFLFANFAFLFLNTLMVVFGLSVIAKTAPKARLVGLGLSAIMVGNVCAPSVGAVMFERFGAYGTIFGGILVLVLGLVSYGIGLWSHAADAALAEA